MRLVPRLSADRLCMGLLACSAAALVAKPIPANAAVFESKAELAAFCAGAALSAIPAPDDPAPPAPVVVEATMGFVRSWMERALGEDPAAGLTRVNEQGAAIAEMLDGEAAPFYDLNHCDGAEPPALWASVPVTSDTASDAIPRSGPITLDRLADDREIDLFRSITGRLRSEYARLTVRKTFVDDVRILALRHALAAADGDAAGQLRLRLAGLLQARAIGAPSRNLELAIQSFEAAALELDPQHPRWGMAKRGECLAYLLRVHGDRADNLERAVAACQAAVQNLDRPGTRADWANAQLTLAGALFDRVRGRRSVNIEEAIAADRAALAARSRTEDPVAWATTQANLGSHLAANPFGDPQQNIEAAVAAYEAASTIITSASPTGWLVLQSNLAGVIGRRERNGLAANQETAIAMFERIRSSPHAWGALRAGTDYKLGLLYRRRLTGDRDENLGEAVRYFRRALLGNGVDGRMAIACGQALGNALIALGRYEEARDALKIAARAAEELIGIGVDQAQLRDIFRDAGDIYALAAYAAAKTGQPRQALEILSSGKARLLFTAYLAEQLDLSPAEASELQRLRGDLQEGEAELERLVRVGNLEATTDLTRVEDLEATRARILALYEKGARNALTQPSAESAIDAGVLLAPIITEFGAIVLAARPSGEVAAVDAPALSRDQIDRLVRLVSETRRAEPLDPPRDEDLEALRIELGQTLGAALRKAIASADLRRGQTIIVLPDGASAILPLSLALDPTSTRSLLDDYAIRFSPSLAALHLARERARRRGAVSLGLLLPPQDSGLQFAAVEGDLIAAAFRGKPSQVWQDADKEAFLGAAGTSSYWHMATHGWFDWDDVRASGVVVGDGGDMLTLGDLLEAREKVGAPRLVVLSACSTGITEIGRNPDEFTGLPIGMIMAGAAGVVASLWPVDDLSTTFLMSRFYDLHLGSRQKPADALRNAQLWLRDATRSELYAYARSKRTERSLGDEQLAVLDRMLGPEEGSGFAERPFAAPRFWGAFVIYGE